MHRTSASRSPSTPPEPIVEQLQQGKTVTKAYLGVSTTPLDPSVAAQNGIDIDHGLLIVDISRRLGSRVRRAAGRVT